MATKEVKEAQVQGQGTGAAKGTQDGTQQPANGGEKKAELAEQKKVKIHTTEDIDSIVSGIPYKFAKGKDVQVPADVAAILVNAQKAYRQ
jgi:hypothetical protein